MSSDRRRSPRMEILGRLHGHVTSLDVPVTVRDISLGGLSMETAIPFPEGAVHEFRLTMGDGSTVDMRGKVVRCQAATGANDAKAWISGVQFLDEEPTGESSQVTGIVDRLK